MELRTRIRAVRFEGWVLLEEMREALVGRALRRLRRRRRKLTDAELDRFERLGRLK